MSTEIEPRAVFSLESTYTAEEAGALAFIAARHPDSLIVTSSHPRREVRAYLIVRINDGDDLIDYWVTKNGRVYLGKPDRNFRESVRTDEIVFEWSWPRR